MLSTLNWRSVYVTKSFRAIIIEWEKSSVALASFGRIDKSLGSFDPTSCIPSSYQLPLVFPFFFLLCFVFIGLCDYFDFVSLHSTSDIHVCGSKLYSYCSLRRRFIFFEWDFHLNVLITVEVTAWSVRSSSSFSSM